eukprot:15440761-Alexandrium_andersonii.AAC.1
MPPCCSSVAAPSVKGYFGKKEFGGLRHRQLMQNGKMVFNSSPCPCHFATSRNCTRAHDLDSKFT